MDSLPSNSDSNTRTALLHRVRFVDYSPSAVSALALSPRTYDPAGHYSHAPSLKSENGREILAVGRQNGAIDIHVWIGGDGKFAGRRNGKNKGERATHDADGARQGWILEKTLAAPHPSRVEHLLFTHQVILSDNDKDLLDADEQARELQKMRRERPRMFSAGGGSELCEWDWSDSLGRIKRTLPSNGGAIWSIAANPQNTMLALGCDDGAVRLVSLWDGELEHVRRFDAVKTRLLSIAWGPMVPVPSSKGKEKAVTEDDSDDEGEDQQKYEDAVIVTGCGDSSIRAWDVRSGRCTQRMTTDKVKGEHTLVWAVGVLHDGTVVSGDSMGLVKFYDGRMGTQIQSIKAHASDILTLSLGPDGKTVYSAGVDGKLAQIRHVRTQKKQPNGRSLSLTNWVLTMTRRMHLHDIRALAVSPSFDISHPVEAKVPIVISGGLDFSLVYTPASTLPETAALPNPVSDSAETTFPESFHRKASFIPQRSGPVVFASGAGLLVCRRETEVDIWRLDKGEEPYEKVLEMDLNTRTNLISHAISPDGKWLAVSDLHEAKVFKLWTSSADGTMRAKRSHAVQAVLSSDPILSGDLGASVLHFTADSSRLVIGTAHGSRIVIVGLPESGDEAAILRHFNQHRMGRQALGRVIAGQSQAKANVNGHAASEPDQAASSEDDLDMDMAAQSEAEDIEGAEEEASLSTIACVATSPDGQWLVTADLARRLHVFNLDSLRYHAALPSLIVPPVAMAFVPSSPSLLVVALPNNSLQVFDVDARSIPSFARRLVTPASRIMHKQREPVLGMAFDPSPALCDTLVIYGASWLSVAKLAIPRTSAVNSKRRRGGSEEDDDDNEPVFERPQQAATINHKYQPILLLDFTENAEMVIVERPLNTMLGDMAPAFKQSRYGAN